jgi:large subunit ribosomal protein L35
MKTNSGAKKRFKLTGGNRVKRNTANRRHNLSKKTRQRKRDLRGGAMVDRAQEHQVKRMLPYG